MPYLLEQKIVSRLSWYLLANTMQSFVGKVLQTNPLMLTKLIAFRNHSKSNALATLTKLPIIYVNARAQYLLIYHFFILIWIRVAIRITLFVPNSQTCNTRNSATLKHCICIVPSSVAPLLSEQSSADFRYRQFRCWAVTRGQERTATHCEGTAARTDCFACARQQTGHAFSPATRRGMLCRALWVIYLK